MLGDVTAAGANENDDEERTAQKRERARARAGSMTITDGDVVFREREASNAASEVSVSSAAPSPAKKRATESEGATPVAEAVEGAPAPTPSPSTSARKRGQRVSRELRRLTEEVFDGIYWRTSVTTTTTTTTMTETGTVVETLQEVEEDVVPVDSDSQEPDSEEDVAQADAAAPKDDAKSEVALQAAYLHSESARLRQAKEVGSIIVPDLNGQISMDGDYWKISESGRRRQRRDLQFFPTSHKLGSSTPSLPRAPPSPETQARRQARQMQVTAERRQERQEMQQRQNEAYAELVAFSLEGRVVVPQLLLGGEVAAENTAWVLANVDYIINVSGMRFAYGEHFVGEDRVLVLDVDDNVHSDMGVHFRNVADRVEAAIVAGKRVFIHCRQGRSRSAALVTAFLVLKRGMTLSAALQLVAEKNRGHNINAGFLRQLEQLECAHMGCAVSSIFQSREMRRQ